MKGDYRGILQVTDNVYQSRNYGHSNMTFVESLAGILIFDPLRSQLSSRAALTAFRRVRGQQPVLGVVCTRSHIDHYGGLRGVAYEELVESGHTEIIAPNGFYEVVSAVSGAVGEAQLFLPTVEVDSPGEEVVVDGLELEFQKIEPTPTHVETNLFLPQLGVFYVAQTGEQATHDILIRSGFPLAEVQNRAVMLEEAIEEYAKQADVLLAPQNCVIWGNSGVVRYLEQQRRLMLRLMRELPESPRKS